MKQHITIRLPSELLDKVESYRQDLEKTTGLTINRADAIRALVAAGLEVKTKERTK